MEAQSVRGSRGRGRPLLETPRAVLEKIRRIAREGGLYRIHRTDGSLYARARRQFGSWAAAVEAAGIDYGQVLSMARRRSLETRSRLRRQRSTSPSGRNSGNPN